MAYKKKSTSEKRDIYQEITNRIIEAMEEGKLSFQKAWNGKVGAALLAKPINGLTKKPYTKENLFLLQLIMDDKQSKDPRFFTFRQAQQAGYGVKKGAKGIPVKQGFFATKDRFGLPLPENECHWTSRISIVFHASDVVERVLVLDKDGKPVTEPVLDTAGKPKLTKDGNPVVRQVFEERPIPDYVPQTKGYSHDEQMELAEDMLQKSGAKIYHDQADEAYYSSTRDEIHLPPKEAFPELANYYATALHELGHWTGHESRLNREMKNLFGTPAYAKEELRAEMASAFLSADLGLPLNTMDHAAYTQDWIQKLKKDKMEFFKACNDAQKIANYLKDLVRTRMKEMDEAHEQAEKPENAKQTEKAKENPQDIAVQNGECILTVYQAPNGYHANYTSFADLEEKVDLAKYKPVYQETATFEKGLVAGLNHLFAKLNRDDRPNGNTMRSMSMGDIVRVNDRFFYTDRVGFIELNITPIKDKQIASELKSEARQKAEAAQKAQVGTEKFAAYQEKFRKVFVEGAKTTFEDCIGNPAKRYSKFIYDSSLERGLSSIRPSDQHAWQEADRAFLQKSFEDSLGDMTALMLATKVIQANSPYTKISEDRNYGMTLAQEFMKSPEYKKIREDNREIATSLRR